MYFTETSIKKVYTVGLLFVILLVVFDLLTYYFYQDTIFGKIFLATREQTPLTWISSLTFILLAIPCFNAYKKTKLKSWNLLGWIFLFFSMDDAVYFHERISGSIVDNVQIFSNFPTYIWIVLYAPLLLFALITLVRYLWKDSDRTNQKHICIAVTLLGCAVFLDLSDGIMEKNSEIVMCLTDDCHMMMVHMMRLSEEVLEVLAIGLLGYLSIFKYALLEKTKNTL